MNLIEVQKQRAIDQHSIQAEEFARRYEALSQEAYRSCFAYSRRRLDALLERALPRRGDGLSLLDIGCGTGHHMRSLRERGFTVAGVDGSEDMLAHARANNPGAEIERADVEEIPFPDRSFDFIVCIEVLRYLPDSFRSLQEMARVLKPGGICLATATPAFNLNGYWLVNRLANLVAVGNLVRLKQYFTSGYGLKQDFIKAGFINPTVTGVYFGPVNWVERLAPFATERLLKMWEPLDARLSNISFLQDLSNMFLVRARRGE
jgi:ubiquinone/menaquinone biosynthesis C-methylase UbiE